MSEFDLRERLAALLRHALDAALADGALPPMPAAQIGLDRRGDELADYASADALRLARGAKMPPRAIAEAIAAHVEADAAIAEVTVAGPGFVNIRLDDAWVLDQIEAIVNAGAAFGPAPVADPQRVQVEYLSANPTGPLTVGAGRIGVVGDAIARMLAARGHDVTREYYVNDAGRQIELLGQTVHHHYAAALGVTQPFPEDGYRGAYVAEWGRTIAAEDGDRWLDLQRREDAEAFEQRSVAIALTSIQHDLADLEIEFDEWYSEREMRARGEVEAALATLTDAGHVTHREGATWFVGGEGTEDRENVLVRSRGDPTYFATDIAYHHDKFRERKFDLVINIWGADHQGHVPRMKAAMEALGIDPARLEILVAQMVGVRSGDGLARAGKRSGRFVTLREVLDEVGPAATRYFFLSKAIDSQMEFDLELAKREDPENPDLLHPDGARALRRDPAVGGRESVRRDARPLTLGRAGSGPGPAAAGLSRGDGGRVGLAGAAPHRALPAGARPRLSLLLQRSPRGKRRRRADGRPAAPGRRRASGGGERLGVAGHRRAGADVGAVREPPAPNPVRVDIRERM